MQRRGIDTRVLRCVLSVVTELQRLDDALLDIRGECSGAAVGGCHGVVDSVQGSRHSAYDCNHLHPIRKRPCLFSGHFENGIPAGKRSRDLVLAEAQLPYVWSDESSENSTLGGFLVPDDESTEEYSEDGPDRSATESHSDTDSKSYCTDTDTEMHVKRVRRWIVDDTDSESETEGDHTGNKRRRKLPSGCLLSETETDGEASTTESMPPAPDYHYDTDSNSTEYETGSNVSESLL